MTSRAMLLVALAAFQFAEVTRASDEPKLSGSEMKIDDAAFNYGDVILSGEVKEISQPTLIGPSQPGVSSYKVDVQVSQRFIGAAPDKVTMTVFTYDIARPNDFRGDIFEYPPKVGNSYIFFAGGKQDQFTALKVILATDANLSKVSKLLIGALGSSQEGKWNKLTGSSLKVDAAVSKSDEVFIGEVTGLGAEVSLPPDASYAGPLLRGIKVKVSHVVRGSPGDHISLSMYVVTISHEQPLATGLSYIFFVQTKGESVSNYPYNCLEKADAETIAIKLLPATDDNIATVKKLVSN